MAESKSDRHAIPVSMHEKQQAVVLMRPVEFGITDRTKTTSIFRIETALSPKNLGRSRVTAMDATTTKKAPTVSPPESSAGA